MKRSTILFIVLILVSGLLAACSGGGVSETKPGQPDPPAGQDARNGPALTLAEDQAEGGGDEIEGYTDAGFGPTPSPLFKQSYEPNPVNDRDYSEFEIVTLLPPDGILALSFPDYYDVKAANEEYSPEEMVIGIEFNGDARAYSVPLLSRHEIVNDTVGGIRLSVTW